MTNEELFQKLRPIVELVTGLPNGQVILADQSADAPAPSGVYASIYPRQTVVERGQANIYTKDLPGDLVQYDVRAQIIASCSVNFFRGNSHSMAESLKQCNKRPDVSLMLFKSGLGWNGTDAVNNLTGLQSARWEQETIAFLGGALDVHKERRTAEKRRDRELKTNTDPTSPDCFQKTA